MKRRWNLLLPAGFLVALAAFFSYFLFFARFPATRDFPWVNLLLFAGSGGLLAAGLRRAFRQPERYRGKLAGAVLGALSVLILGFFLAYNFYLSAQLPPSKSAPRVGQKAPEFTLPDTHGKPVKLAELLVPARGEALHRPVQGGAELPVVSGAEPRLLLIFYRGYW